MLQRPSNDKLGTSRVMSELAVAAATAVVASLAVAGTAAAQFGPRFDDVPQGHYAYTDDRLGTSTTRSRESAATAPISVLRGHITRTQIRVPFLKRATTTSSSARVRSTGSNDDEVVATLVARALAPAGL